MQFLGAFFRIFARWSAPREAIFSAARYLRVRRAYPHGRTLLSPAVRPSGLKIASDGAVRRRGAPRGAGAPRPFEPEINSGARESVHFLSVFRAEMRPRSIRFDIIFSCLAAQKSGDCHRAPQILAPRKFSSDYQQRVGKHYVGCWPSRAQYLHYWRAIVRCGVAKHLPTRRFHYVTIV